MAKSVIGQQGKNLERLIDRTNLQYFNKGVLDVRKVPTPVTVFKRNPRTGRISDGAFTKGEWVDYVGIDQEGNAITFDAKETKIKTSFPLMDNLHDHQYRFLKSWHQKGAKCFLIVQFIEVRYETYLLPFEVLQRYYEGAMNGERKSIPYKEFAENCKKITSQNGIILDYLDCL